MQRLHFNIHLNIQKSAWTTFIYKYLRLLMRSRGVSSNKPLKCHVAYVWFHKSLLTPYHSLSSAGWNLLCFMTVIQTPITSQIIFRLLINCPIPASLDICLQATQRLPSGHPYTPRLLSHGHNKALKEDWFSQAKMTAEHRIDIN